MRELGDTLNELLKFISGLLKLGLFLNARCFLNVFFGWIARRPFIGIGHALTALTYGRGREWNPGDATGLAFLGPFANGEAA